MAMAAGSAVASRAASGGYKQVGCMVLSDVLLSVRSVILQHEPLSAAHLLAKLAEMVAKEGFAICLREWSEAVDTAAIEARQASRSLAVMQEAVLKKERSCSNEQHPAAAPASEIVSGPGPATTAHLEEPSQPEERREIPQFRRRITVARRALDSKRPVEDGLPPLEDLSTRGARLREGTAPNPSHSVSSSRDSPRSFSDGMAAIMGKDRTSELPELRDSLELAKVTHSLHGCLVKPNFHDTTSPEPLHRETFDE
eukprot:TRINITY_DN23049_c0_g1_i1.p1 TRINITY_DN23049_c0_g1~~TRINITY_DN23049_c0_g1_i1.p1  ORF type:complete len:255 (-),score=36.89 TRINITY_DN23049_c0_g1_i1:1137-1901(-)